MNEIKLGVVETQFAEIVWEHAPLTTRELVKHCHEKLNWARTTTYTVLRKLGEKGIFELVNGTVFVRIKRDAFYAIQSEQFVEDAFDGSLPAFVAAFTSRKKPSKKELAEIKALLDAFEEG